jgi:hypothetical protein
VPLRLNEVVLVDVFAVTPTGKAPDASAHLYGVQPLLAVMAAEYAVWTVPLGTLVVLIVIVEAKQGHTTTSNKKPSHLGFMPHAGRDLISRTGGRGLKTSEFSDLPNL